MENRHPRLGLRRRYRSNQCLKAVESPVWAADCIKGGGSLDRIRIRGGRGLRGTVRVSGSKNGALPILAASLMVDGPMLLRNMPRLKDVENLLRILGKLGVVHSWRPDGSLELEARDKTVYEAPYDLVRTMRASFVVLGPLWARRGVAQREALVVEERGAHALDVPG